MARNNNRNRNNKSNNAQNRNGNSKSNMSNFNGAAIDSSRLMNLSSRVSLAQSIGQPIPITSASDGVFVANDDDGLISPAYMIFGVWVTPGLSRNSNSAVNIMGSTHYGWVRKYNTGYADNYQQNDMVMYELAIGYAAAMHAEFTRLIGIMNQDRNSFNRTTPQWLVQALGYDYNNLKSNMPSLMWQVERFGQALNTYFVPANPLFSATNSLFSKLWKDEDSETAQIYVFAPTTYYTYTDTPSGGGLPILEYHQTAFSTNSDSLWDIDDITDCINTILNALFSHTSMEYMSKDLAKSSTRAFTVASVPDNYVVYPEYSLDMLHKIRNMRIIPGMNPLTLENSNITQEDNAVIFDPTITGLSVSDALPCALNAFMDTHGDSWSDENTASALEFSIPGCQVSEDKSGQTILSFRALPNLIISNAYVYTVNMTEGSMGSRVFNSSLPVQPISGNVIPVSSLAVQNFEYAPLRIATQVTPTSGSASKGGINVYGFEGNTDHINPIPDSTLYQMIDSRVWSYFGLPENTLA